MLARPMCGGTLASEAGLAAWTSKGLPPPLCGFDFCVTVVLLAFAEFVLDVTLVVEAGLFAGVEDACETAEEMTCEEVDVDVSNVELTVGELDVSMIMPPLGLAAADVAEDDDGSVFLA